ncbi:hypothetical protein D3C75_1227990 [compost metagenome]
MVFSAVVGILVCVDQVLQALAQDYILVIVNKKFQLVPELQLVAHLIHLISLSKWLG